MTTVETLNGVADSPVVDVVGTVGVVALSVSVAEESPVQAVILSVFWLSFLLQRRGVTEWIAVGVIAVAPLFAGVVSLAAGDGLWEVGVRFGMAGVALGLSLLERRR